MLIHPFALSHDVWHDVIPRLADEYDVVAMTLPGHWGGPKLRRREMTLRGYADAVEVFLDKLGWDTCHIAGNSIGGWLACELALRGRARSIVAIAPAGGWTRFSTTQLLCGLKFLLVAPFALLGWATGELGARIGWIRRLALRTCVMDPRRVPDDRAANFVRASSRCPSFMPFMHFLWADLVYGGVKGLDRVDVKSTLMLCDSDWMVPPRRYGRFYADGLRDVVVVNLPDVGHCPMLENPELVADALLDHLRRNKGDGLTEGQPISSARATMMPEGPRR